MDFEKPSATGYTIYSKSGCILCNKVKDLLKTRCKPFTVIDSDEYLIEDKEGFVAFMESCAGKSTGGFPKVFVDGGFVGSYAETKEHLDKTLTFDDSVEF